MRPGALRLAAALFALYVLWGSNYVGIKIALGTMPPFALLALRWACAGLFLFALTAPRGDRAADPLGPRQWLATFVLACVLLGAGNGSVFFAEGTISSGLTALLVGTVPLWGAILGAVIDRGRGGRIAPTTLAGLTVGMTGLVVLLDPHASRSDWVAIGVALGGALVWAFGSVIAGRLPVPKRPLVSAAMQMMWVGAIFVVVAALAGEWPRSLTILTHPWSPTFLWTFLWLVFCAGLLGYIAYLWLLRNVSLTIANSYAFVNPAVAVALGIVLLHEPLTLRIVAGTAIVVAAVTLIVLKPAPRPIEETS